MNQTRRINKNRAFKIVYVIGNREVSRKELINYLAENVYYDTQHCRVFGLDKVNYSKAKKQVNMLYQMAYRDKRNYYVIVVGSKYEFCGVEVK